MLGFAAGLEDEFAKRNCKMIGLSVGPVDNYAGREKDIEETQGHKVKFLMISDTDLNVSKLYNMFPADKTGTVEGRTALTNAAIRSSVFIIEPDKTSN